MVDQVKLEINIEDKNAQASLKRLGTSINKFSDNTSKSLTRTNQVFNSFVGNLAANTAARALALLTASISEAIGEFVQFDRH